MTCGIYMIQNKVNGKIYIGQAIDIKRRWRRHKGELNNNKHKNEHLQSAWNKYGQDNFEFSIIYECKENQLNTYEEYYIFELMSYNSIIGYNKNYGGNSSKMTEETKKKISEAVNREEVKRINSEKHKGNTNMLGKHHTEEAKKKISESKKGTKAWNKGIKMSEEEILKRSKRVYCAELDIIFNSVKEASIELNICRRSIYKVCRGERETAGGYHWEFVEE